MRYSEDQGREKPTLAAVLEHLEVDFNPERTTGMAPCPLHDDNTPSFSYHLDRGLWKCHSCGEGGDSYTLIMKKEKTDFAGARALAASLCLATGDAGGGDHHLSGSAYGARRSVPSRSRNHPGRGGYVPAWRRN
ncbi:CHC2 zinc finger domain-containing protein [Streptomyces sp. CC77]|uniref:CHC2 zinc finger domain-containing protein n=1 Tax=Streptomyces sp. CC77 TaxID=1906739 RepID=UPI0020C8BB89|nr:CHC2 zinc finger domain-containing protein [Streptomyces sp. CC77]